MKKLEDTVKGFTFHAIAIAIMNSTICDCQLQASMRLEFLAALHMATLLWGTIGYEGFLWRRRRSDCFQMYTHYCVNPPGSFGQVDTYGHSEVTG